jgi:hypothetical protein
MNTQPMHALVQTAPARLSEKVGHVFDHRGGAWLPPTAARVTDHARERFADPPADVAFAKLYEADVMLRKALRVVRDGAWGYASGG